MQARILQVVDPGRGGDGAHVADVLDHRGERDRQDGDDRGDHQAPVGVLEHGEGRIVPAERQADPGGFLHLREIHLAEAGSDDVGAEHTEQDRHDLDHALAPDVADHDDQHGHDGDPPVLAAVLDGGAGQGQTDRDDDRTRDDGREKTEHPLGAESGEQAGEHEVHQRREEHADAGVGQRSREVKSLLGTHLRDGGISAEERERGTQESRDLELREYMEKQGSDTCEEQGRGDGETGDHRYEDSGPEHREEMLEAEDGHLARAKGPGIVNCLLYFSHGI